MKQLSVEEQKNLDVLIERYVNTPIVQSMKQYIQHGTTTTYEHVMKVTETCFKVNRRWRLHADEEILISAAVLHDFYLYDWHEDSDDHRLHGFFHAKKAAKNAKKHFDIDMKVYKAIKSHMWPLTLRSIPTSKEAWILCLSDKWCAFSETFSRKRQRRKG